MTETEMEKRAVRTVRRKHSKDLLAVLFFLLLLPYTCSVLFGARQEEAVETSGGVAGFGGFILWEKQNGVRQIPVEDFLTGALAACMPAEYREETLKAQAVILRSICLREMEENGVLKKEESQLEILEKESRQTLWGEDFAENEARFRQAVRDTDGIVLTKNGGVVKPPYFRLSAGKTRSGAEIFGVEAAAVKGGEALPQLPEGKTWCRSVECPHDMEAEAFLQEIRIRREAFAKKLWEEGIKLPEKGGKITLTRDSAGYVLFVDCGDKQMEGEKFRELFSLPSACFSIREEDGEILLQTKGVGHGLGFNQYGADLLAAGGKDYLEILDCFFTGLKAEKVRMPIER